MEEIPRKFKENNYTPGHKRTEEIKTKLNLLKLKAQTEIFEDRTIQYITKYLEIDLELMTESKNLASQRHSIYIMRRKLRKEGGKTKKNPRQKTT